MSFELGDLVCLKADAERVGSVVAVLPSVGGQLRYRVFHGPGAVAEYTHDQLTIVDQGTHDLSVFDGQVLEPGTLRAHLTAAQLKHPRTDDIYALTAARIQFIPFQFRPVIRLLRADEPRLLIADEVGVGKTIEAGLILQELSARTAMDAVLVMCPKALTVKWQKEMLRFDENFRILDAAALKYCLQETHNDGAWPQEYSRAIVHYELLRIESYLTGDERRRWPGLLELDPPPVFDLVIADEAHHLRTPGTNQHQLAHFFGQASNAYVMLSATPIQLGSGDLFSLLNVLRPDVFNSPEQFETMLEPNASLTRAAASLRRPDVSDWRTEALTQLDQALSTAWGQRALGTDPRSVRTRASLMVEEPMDDETRIRCLRDLEDLNTLSHVMNRTRRRDIGRFTIREPQTVRVPFTNSQQRFYDQLLDARQSILRQQYPANIVRMIMDTLERQASSCLPALAPAIAGMVAAGKLSESVMSDAPEVDDDEDQPPADVGLTSHLVRIAEAASNLTDEDPKFDGLLRIVQETRDSGGPGKVLLFSFFLHTIYYLESRLRQAGIRVGVVTGRVQDTEREQLRERFSRPTADPEALDVLLSSEVGCEGLDYQFCDRLVNYDIPWNPMRIEQRIGRIDRFGQPSNKVLIFNFITPGTVEERIFWRCFDRLGIFRNAIGDLESVLGDTVESLSQLALDPSLTEQQAAEQVQQISDNVLRRAAEEEALEAASGDLLGVQRWKTDDVDELVEDGRFVSPTDVEHLMRTMLALPGLAGEVSIVAEAPKKRRLRMGRETRTAIDERLRSVRRPQSRTALEMRRWLAGNDPHLVVTFDQAQAATERETPFLTPIHPLVQVAVQAMTDAAGGVLAGQFTAISSEIPIGRYLVSIDSWETIAVRPEIRTSVAATPLDGQSSASAVESQFMSLLSRGTPGLSQTPDPAAMRRAVAELDERAESLRRTESARVADENGALLTRKLASLDVHHASRLAWIQEQFTSASNERIRRMRHSQLTRAVGDHEQRRTALAGRAVVDVVGTRLCLALLEVRSD